MIRGLEDLKSSKDAFNALLPESLAALVNPKHIIGANLLTLKSSFLRFTNAALGIASVSDYICEMRYG